MTSTPVPPAPDAPSYMAAVAGSPSGMEYKARAVEALALSAGHVVVDVGCGPGTDLQTLATAVGPTGTVLGVDRDEAMLARAREIADACGAELRRGDLHDLPLPDAGVDRLRTDRVLQHVDDPRRALAEVARVLRPGGRAVLAEPDWDTLAIAAEDPRTSWLYRDFVRDVVVRNADVGRHLAGLAHRAGLHRRDVVVSAGVFTEHGTADTILGVTRNVERATASGHMTTGRDGGPVPCVRDRSSRPWRCSS